MARYNKKALHSARDIKGRYINLVALVSLAAGSSFCALQRNKERSDMQLEYIEATTHHDQQANFFLADSSDGAMMKLMATPLLPSSLHMH